MNDMMSGRTGGPARLSSSSASPTPRRLTLAEWVRLHRRARGWSQRELARRTGMSRGTVARLEAGVGKAQRRTRTKLREVFVASQPGQRSQAA